jgi:hypothetical protein
MQGDIFERCPVFAPPSNLKVGATKECQFSYEERDVIILSQSCDMEQKKITQVLLCLVSDLSEHTRDHLSTPQGKEDARKGSLPGVHMLAACTLPDFKRGIRIVDFHSIFSLPLPFLSSLAAANGKRVRLLPPYREHLSQAFARFFMRVGLPTDIPKFK